MTKTKFSEARIIAVLGRRIRILAIAEDTALECLALVVDTSRSGARCP